MVQGRRARYGKFDKGGNKTVNIKIDEEHRKLAQELGLPIFKLQIDWRYVPKELRNLKSFEVAGYIEQSKSKELMSIVLEDRLKELTNEK